MSLPAQSPDQEVAVPPRRHTHRGDILFTIAVLLGLLVAYRVRDVLLLIYVSALFAVVLSPAIDGVRRVRLGKWRPSRGLAILLIVIAGLALLAIFVIFAVPPIFHDLQGVAADLPRRVSSQLDRIRHLPFAQNLNFSVLQENVARAMGGVVGVFKGVAGGVVAFFSWLILTAYFILDGERAFRWAMSLFPPRRRQRLESALLRAEVRVRHWLVGQAALMLILGLSSALAFGLLRIKYFYALAVIAGGLNIVPVVGPLVSLVLAATVAAFDSWTKLLGVLAFYFVYQQIENAFLTPRIMKFSVNLPPLAVIVALAMGGALAGVLGALIAVPTAAVLAVLIDEYLISRPQAAD